MTKETYIKKKNKLDTWGLFPEGIRILDSDGREYGNRQARTV